MQRRRVELNTGNTILAVVILVVLFLGLFWLAKSIFTILMWLTPVFLILTLIINYRIVLDYGKMLWNLLNNNPIMGVIGIVLTIIGFPVVSLFLFARAMLHRKVKNIEKQNEMASGEFVDYEIVEESETSNLELPEMQKQARSQQQDSEYDHLFD